MKKAVCFWISIFLFTASNAFSQNQDAEVWQSVSTGHLEHLRTTLRFLFRLDENPEGSPLHSLSQSLILHDEPSDFPMQHLETSDQKTFYLKKKSLESFRAAVVKSLTDRDGFAWTWEVGYTPGISVAIIRLNNFDGYVVVDLS